MARKNHRKGVPQRRKGGTPSFRAVSSEYTRCVTGKSGFPYAVAEVKLDEYSNGDRERTPKGIYKCQHCNA